jgi:hypothetical protein
MTTLRTHMILAIVLAFLVGSVVAHYWDLNSKGDSADYSQLLILSELEHQANILRAISDNDLPRASEFSIARMQSDLSFFQEAIDKKNPPVDKPRLCKNVFNVDGKISAYLSTEPTKGQYVRSSLDRLKSWCENRPTEAK